MALRRCELTDFEWSIIEPLLRAERHLLVAQDRVALGRHPETLWPLHHKLQSFRAMGACGC